MRLKNWEYQYMKIESANNRVLVFDSVLNIYSDARNRCRPGWGYYLDGKAEMLDKKGEWVYDVATNSVLIYGKTPNNALIEATVTNKGVVLEKNTDHIVFNDIHFTKYNVAGILAKGENKGIRIVDCRFSNINQIALDFREGSSHCTISNNELSDILGAAMMLKEVNHFIISGNSVKRIGLIPGYGINGINGGLGICVCNNEVRPEGYTLLSHHNLISENRIDSTGWISIRMDGHDNICEKNVVTNAVVTYNDGGIFHSWGTDSAYTYNSIIRNNIFSNSIGFTEGALNDHKMNNAIYLDNNTHHFIVENNTVSNAGSGIHVNDGAYNNIIRNNVSYGNKKCISFAEWNNTRHKAVCKNNVAKNNIMFNTYNLKYTLSLMHTYEPKFNPAQLDSNTYVSPNEKYHIRLQTMNDGYKNTKDFTLKAWKEFSGQDGNSVFIDLKSSVKHELFTNDQPTTKTIALNKKYTYYTLDNEKVESIELKPYHSQILYYE